MDAKWKVLLIFATVVVNELCSGFPINLENSGTDSHTQLLTGLVAVLLTVCCIVALAGCLCCTRNNGFKENDKEFHDSPVVVSVSSNVDHGHVNPIANGEFTIFTPLSPPHFNNNIFLANQEALSGDPDDYKYGDIDIRSWFNESEKEFPRTKLKYIRELGKGWFGRVVEGAAQDLSQVQSWVPVVVRILEANTSTKNRVLFLNDANIYRHEPHSNILPLLGRSLDTVPMLLIQEFCPKGDLKKYLNEQANKKEGFLTSELPLRWCGQLAAAVKHLHHQNVTHPDLAARNCLITDDLNLKIGDYGLANSNYPEDYYLASPGLPIRWCSPESINYTSTTIQPNKVTLESNIWAFGVTMWEVFECGSQPYTNLNDDEVISQVLGSPSLRLPRPSNAVLYTDYMYRLMQMCWTSFELRPKITQIQLMIEDLLHIYENMKLDSAHIGDFEERWHSFKPNTIVKTDNHEPSPLLLRTKTSNHKGSLNNLLDSQQQEEMDSWLENVATSTDDLSYVRGLHDAMNDLDNVIALENVSSSESSHRPSPAPQKNRIEFKLGPQARKSKDSDSFSATVAPKTSSESETEEENWKRKIERGAYSEKVRQKSRSVTDLMVLTHIDCSESESETPLQSLDYRVNYKNVRLANQNLENTSLMFGSEGNLLSVKDTFQEELRKLREERKDSLLFVPVTNSSSSPETERIIPDSNPDLDPDLNLDRETKPSNNQVFNVYNVTVQTDFNPEPEPASKLKDIINFHDLVLESDIQLNEKDATLPDIISDIHQNLSTAAKYKLTNGDSHYQNNQESLQFSELRSKNPPVSLFKPHSKTSASVLKNTSDNYSESNSNINANGFDLFETNPKLEDVDSNTSTLRIEAVNDVSHPESEMKIALILDANLHKPDAKTSVLRNAQNCPESNSNINANGFDLFESHSKLEDVDSNTSSLKIEELNDVNHLESETKTAPFLDVADVNINILASTLNSNTNTNSNVLDLNSNTPLDIRNSSNVDLEDVNPESRSKTAISDIVDVDDINLRLQETDEQQTCTNLRLNNNKTCQIIAEERHELETNSNNNVHTISIVNNAKNPSPESPNTSVSDATKTANSDSKSDTEELDLQTEINLNLKDALCDSMTSNNSLELKSDSVDEELSASTPKKSKLTELENGVKVIFGSCADHTINLYSGLKTCSYLSSSEAEELQFSSNFIPTEESECLNYSLDSWDNFLDKALDKQEGAAEFDNFNSEPASLTNFTVEGAKLAETIEGGSESEPKLDDTFLLNKNDQTFTIEDHSNDSGEWESGEGWFLHEQSLPEELSGDMNIVPETSDSYVGFSMDDDVMSAIRNELLMKLPQAQRVSNEKLMEQEEVESGDNIEVFIKFNTILSPIAEESFSEEHSCQNTPERLNSSGEESDEDSDWTEPALQSNIEDIPVDTATQSPQIFESPAKEPHHRHTPSQDSCCSNDTLFNLEELIANEQDRILNKDHNVDVETELEETDTIPEVVPTVTETILEAEAEAETKTEAEAETNPEAEPAEFTDQKSDKDAHINISINEDDNGCKYAYISDFISSEKALLDADSFNNKKNKQNAPLPSPEDRQWKDLRAPFLTYKPETTPENNQDYVDIQTTNDYVNCNNVIYENGNNGTQYANLNEETTDTVEPVYVENSAEDRVDDIYGPLTDIRFTGPCDNQLMSTSFSESNDLGDEQDWDSGSDTRSSSSGEFLWKHDEHEESVRALRVAPQESIDEVNEMEGNESESSESTGSEEDGDGPEFVPSAWDKHAMPAKSALRSPEKTLERPDRKPKGVWFKKQKYHCVYEYPKEPESPVLQSCDLWKPALNFPGLADWSQDCYDPKPSAAEPQELDFQNGVPDLMDSSLGGDFFISSSTRPFDNMSALGSEFFPGKCDSWSEFIKLNDNVTPDSGIDDLTPASISDINDLGSPITSLKEKEVQPLKQLAGLAVNKANNQKVLGGLRHTRNKLKLDLPPSPTAFSSTKVFTVEPQEDLVVRNVPTFTTFGKSRFLVQHVDTPTDEKAENYKNVSFEALPHKPLKSQILQEKQSTDAVRGEASLLDSADEDSGIESCTLERKKVANNVIE